MDAKGHLLLSNTGLLTDDVRCIALLLTIDGGTRAGIKVLKINQNKLGDDALAILCDALASNRCLEGAYIQNNCFTERGFRSLADVLEAGAAPNLKVVYLAHNDAALSNASCKTSQRLRKQLEKRGGLCLFEYHELQTKLDFSPLEQ